MELAVAGDIDWTKGAAYLDGAFMPVSDAKLSIVEWGYRRSDATYDVVSVWNGASFRLDDHLTHFRASIAAMPFTPKESDASGCARPIGPSGTKNGVPEPVDYGLAV